MHLQWENFVGKMGKKMMLPVEEVDMSAVKYQDELIKGCVSVLNFLVFVSESSEVDAGFGFGSSTFDWVHVEVVR